MRDLQLEIADDAQDLARRMTRLFLSAAEQAICSRGVFRTALSGGRTPELFLRQLASEPRAQTLAWDPIHVFWVDERYVPPDSTASNYRLVVENLLGRVKIPETNVHRVPTEYEDPRDAAVAYERTIRVVFGLQEGEMPQFDLIVLGMGRDGHTASLFPNSRVWCGADGLAGVVRAGGDVKIDRITLTRLVLQAARRLVVLISGQEKAETFELAVAADPDERRYPIHVLWPVLDRVTWLVDRDAAGRNA
ncbi:MAG TPA: 6-phosphogluconolactonase [Sedimentisphaerales bacterium]|jgi:6-phosphogluconolactonase|nr:6-phosphogluconolactonase [Sedimentisphaerales bacterium]HNU30871.1 6-phosphogluconolactonase [Sedimentisphaerales bacterium]